MGDVLCTSCLAIYIGAMQPISGMAIATGTGLLDEAEGKFFPTPISPQASLEPTTGSASLAWCEARPQRNLSHGSILTMWPGVAGCGPVWPGVAPLATCDCVLTP